MNDENLFSDYETQSVQDAIEALAVSFLGAGVPVPVKIVLPKGGLTALNNAFRRSLSLDPAKEVPATAAAIMDMNSCAGKICFVEEGDVA